MQPATDLKQLAGEVAELSSRLVDLLEQAVREAAQSADESLRNYAPTWATLAIKNISGYRNNLDAALHAHDPSGLWHAAGQFADMPRYVDDYDYRWFSRSRELDELLSMLHKKAASIVISIDTFDPNSLEKVRESLL